MRAIGICVLALGCGRLGFGDSSDASTTGDAGTIIDAPPLPARFVCNARVISIPGIAGATDLAMIARTSSYLALWVHGTSLRAMIVDATTSSAPITLAIPPVDGIAGLMETTQTMMFVTSRNATQTLWSMPQLGVVNEIRTETAIAARDPMLTDNTKVPRVWARGTPAGIAVTYINEDGSLRADGLVATGNPVTSVSAASQADHGHLSWTEDAGGGATVCHQADLDLVPNFPVFGGSSAMAANCEGIRNDSGPGPADAILTTWRSSVTGSIEARYLGVVADLQRTLSTQGRAPKVRFDGTRFWIAWIDETVQPVLRLAKFDEDGTFEVEDIPGWAPNGDEAFELVRDGDSVSLVLLGDTTLSLLDTCSP